MGSTGVTAAPRIRSHPAGLAALLFAELGERFSDYGMRALLALLLAGIVIVRGQCSPLRSSIPFFYRGLALIAIGAGLLKPDISTLEGGLYRAADPHRDSGFSLLRMRINAGAAMAPLAWGFLAGSPVVERAQAGKNGDCHHFRKRNSLKQRPMSMRKWLAVPIFPAHFTSATAADALRAS